MKSVSNDSEIMILGDFNLPDVSWNNGIVKCPINTLNKSYVIQNLFLDFFVTNNLQWVISDDIITRRRKVLNTIQQATLDQILFSDNKLFKNVKTISNLGLSDHCGIVCGIGISNDPKYLSLSKENWNKFSIDDIIHHGNQINWKYSQKHEVMSVDEMWSEMSCKLAAVSGNVPTYILKTTQNGAIIEKSPWNRPCLRSARKAKDTFWYIFDQYPTSKNFRLAMQKQNDFQEKLQKCMIGYEKNITANMKSNPKRFFSYLSSKRKLKESLNGIKDSNGNLLGSPSEVADELGKFFKSTFIVEEDGDIPKLENLFYSFPFCFWL